MENFLAFLKSSKALLKTINLESMSLHITLGNESCDLDSSISSLILGYLLSTQHPETTVIPIMNVTRENFLLRTENCFVLKRAGISLEDLVYRGEVSFSDLVSKNTITASIVDHHIVSKNDEIFTNCITQVFDHRPIDTSQSWDQSKVKIRIEPVGSCCTLIADEVLRIDESLLCKPLAFLLYQTIIYDTIALKSEHGKAKPLDIEIGTKLEQKFNFTEDRQLLFDRLWAAHNDVSHLTAKQLLYKDLKVVEGVFIPGLPMLVEEFLNKADAYEAVVNFACEHKVTCILLVGLNVSSGTVQRDIAIFSETNDNELRTTLLRIFNENKEYDFEFEKRATEFGENIELLHIRNTKLSRKQMVPLVKKALEPSK